ncbi:twin-arginine translocase TatA/TatE family subunit [Brevibacillus daliensis]|uniref:twin-arginine translocase TatA/TatE family subunit n=1 Tax=Brevibacillus daliensis TaxID=2892995 RepID=UPI001E4C07D7|nr:twin-arginine translocase TatA/TatE family subunit [Brevibacillus daliensis]
MQMGAAGFILLLVLAVILFGPKKLPELGRAMGSTLREFKKATTGLVNDDDDDNKRVAQNQALPASTEQAAVSEQKEDIDRAKLEREIRERIERERIEREIREKIENEQKLS